jgi:hypothetical protein
MARENKSTELAISYLHGRLIETRACNNLKEILSPPTNYYNLFPIQPIILSEICVCDAVSNN